MTQVNIIKFKYGKSMGMSFAHLMVILLIILVVFGAGKLPSVMSDLGKGLKAFKDALKDEKNNKE